jgi:hypothetical protein
MGYDIQEVHTEWLALPEAQIQCEKDSDYANALGKLASQLGDDEITGIYSNLKFI